MIFKLNYKITKLGKTDKYKYSKEDTAYSRGEWRQHVHKEDKRRIKKDKRRITSEEATGGTQLTLMTDKTGET